MSKHHLLAPAGALLVLMAAGSARADGAPTAPASASASASPPAASPPAAAPPSLYTTGADSRPVEPPPSKTRFGFGAALDTDYYGAPIDVLGFSAFIELGNTEDTHVLSPMFRLTGARSAATMTAGTAGSSFTWYTASLDGCPIQATLVAQRVWIRPCARVTGGLLSASAGAADAHKPWVSAGLLGRLQWRPAGPLFFEVTGGAAYAFTHNEVTLAASGTAMSAPPSLSPAIFEPFGSVGVGLTFP